MFLVRQFVALLRSITGLIVLRINELLTKKKLITVRNKGNIINDGSTNPHLMAKTISIDVKISGLNVWTKTVTR